MQKNPTHSKETEGFEQQIGDSMSAYHPPALLDYLSNSLLSPTEALGIFHHLPHRIFDISDMSGERNSGSEVGCGTKGNGKYGTGYGNRILRW